MNAAQRAQAICEITQEKRREDAQDIAHEHYIGSKEYAIENGVEPGEGGDTLSMVIREVTHFAERVRSDRHLQRQINTALSCPMDDCELGRIVRKVMHEVTSERG